MTILKSMSTGLTLFSGWPRVRLASNAISTALLAGCSGGSSSDAVTPLPAPQPADRPLVDNDVYGSGPTDSVSDSTESAAVTHRQITLNGKAFAYTATAGHLVTIDNVASEPEAKMFYVAYTMDNPDPTKPRPVTFLYSGGPTMSSATLLLGSFGPRRIQSSFPNFTPPALTRESTIRTVCSTAPTSCSLILSALVIRPLSRRIRTRISGAWIRMSGHSMTSSSTSR